MVRFKIDSVILNQYIVYSISAVIIECFPSYQGETEKIFAPLYSVGDEHNTSPVVVSHRDKNSTFWYYFQAQQNSLVQVARSLGRAVPLSPQLILAPTATVAAVQPEASQSVSLHSTSPQVPETCAEITQQSTQHISSAECFLTYVSDAEPGVL